MLRIPLFSIFLWIFTSATFFLNSENFSLVAPRVEILFLVFIIAIAIGAFSFSQLTTHKQVDIYLFGGLYNHRFKILLYIFIALLLFLANRSVSYELFDSSKRNLLFSPQANEGSQAFVVMVLFLKALLMPLVSFSTLYSLIKKNIRLLIISSALIFADSLIFQSRGTIFSMLLIIILYGLVTIPNRKQGPLFQDTFNNKFFYLFLLLIFLSLLVIAKLRNLPLITSLLESFMIGPVIFSNLVSNISNSSNNIINLSELPLLFSGADYLTTIFLRGIFHLPIESIGYDWIRFINQQVVTSTYASVFLTHNAFYTILAEPYLAMNIFGVILLGIFLGFSLSKLSFKYVKFGCEFSLFLLSYLWVIINTGFFGNALASPILWLFIVALPFFKKYLFKRYKS
jgi:oligosaccharide repeat unit polymerase